jgi:hypothetical protein
MGTTITDSNGIYLFGELNAGRYTIEPDGNGCSFEPEAYRGIDIPRLDSIIFNFDSVYGN